MYTWHLVAIYCTWKDTAKERSKSLWIVPWMIHAVQDLSSFCICFMMTSSNGNIFRVPGHLCGEFTDPRWIPAQRPVTRSFDVFFDLHLNKRLSKQWWGWWFETPSCPLWRHRNILSVGFTHIAATDAIIELSQWSDHGPLTRYLKSRIAHASGMLGTFSSPPTSRETAS